MREYIITFEDNPEVEEGGVKYFRCTQAPWSYTSEIMISKLTPYTEPDLDAVKNEAYQQGVEDGAKSVENWNEQEKKLRKDEAYQKGLNDAWDAARKLWEYSATTLKKIFSKCCYFGVWDILRKYSASEVIKKIRKYEQEDAEFHVGDEFITKNNKDFGVIVAANAKRVLVLWKDDADIFDENNREFTTKWAKERFAKTGRNFPEIAEIFKKMKGESNDPD